MDHIKLNFINRSNDMNNSSIVIFQQNNAGYFEELPVAWKVIENCGLLDNHPFVFPLNYKVSASDSYGNYTPQLLAYEGQAFDLVVSHAGHVLQLSRTSATSPTEIEIRNQMPNGAINAHCFRGDKLLAIKTGMAPGQKAVFEFPIKMYIGAVSQVKEGEIMNSAIVDQINTEIDLSGIVSADIVMTGGGPGKSSTAFNFTLDNIIR